MKKPTGKPCKECPFKRTSMPGYLGASGTADFLATTMADSPMPCHQTVNYESRNWKENLSDARFCSGALIFFRNQCKLSRDPKRPQLEANRELVFSNQNEFMEHHGNGDNPNDDPDENLY